jgi:hypothetical protein
MRPCSICRLPDDKLDAIEAACITQPATEVASKYKVSLVMLRRHRAQHGFRRIERQALRAESSGGGNPGPSLLATVSRLLDKTERLASTALAKGDLRASASLIRRCGDLAALQSTLEVRTIDSGRAHGISAGSVGQHPRNRLAAKLGLPPFSEAELAEIDARSATQAAKVKS